MSMNKFKLTYEELEGYGEYYGETRYINLMVRVPYYNCFNKLRHTYVEAISISEGSLIKVSEEEGLKNEKDTLEYMIRLWKKERDSSRYYRNIKRNLIRRENEQETRQKKS